jgi:hypothetical protein
MSTAQDHKALASLQDVFGSGAGSSITRFNNGVGTTSYTGAAGSSGREGETGSPGVQAVNMLGQTYKALKEKEVLKGINKVLSNPNAKRADLQGVLDEGNSFKSGTAKTMKKVGQVATRVGYAGAAGKIAHGELPDAGGLAQDAIKYAIPGVGAADFIGDLISEKYNPLNPIFRGVDKVVKKIPGVKEYVDPALVSAGQAIAGIPGMETAGTIAKNVSKFPDEILSAPAKIWASFGDKAKAAAKSSREFALNDMFEEYAKNDPYSTPPGGWVGTKTVPGGYGERQYNEEIPFQAETKDLWEEYKNTDSYKTVLTAQQGIRDLEEIRGQEALKKLQNERAISELSDPVQNIQPVEDYTDLNIGTHYRDQYGTYDAQTGEKLDVPSIYEPAAPILAAPEAERIYRQPKAVETAPTVKSDELNPLKRVRPEELVTPRIMTPRRIRPQRETASGGAFSSPAWQALDGTASRPSYSKAQAADLLGFDAPLRTASQYMDLDARTKPKHNLRELTTGRNASSY